MARTLNWVEGEVFSIFLARLSRFKLGAFSPTDSFIYSFIYSSPLFFCCFLCHRLAVQVSPSVKKLLSRFKLGVFPRTCDLPSRNDLPTAFLNWPSIQLNIHTTENCANIFKFGALPRTYDLPSRNDLPTAFLNWPSIQLNI